MKIEIVAIAVAAALGEKTAATQPFPTKPPPFARQGITTDDLIDFTPELEAEALKIVESYMHERRQYIAVATGSAGTPGKLVAFALPEKK